MNNDLTYNLHNPGDCIPEQTMFDYIDGKLSAKEQHLVEKHMIDCELCSDALEGLRLVKNRGRIAEINKAVRERIAVPEKKTRVIDFRIVMSVAAGLLLLTGGVFFFRQFAEKKESMAELKEAPNSQTQPEEKMEAQPPVTTEEAVPTDEGAKKEKLKISDREQSGDYTVVMKDVNGAGAVSPVAADELSIAENEKVIRPDEDVKNNGTFAGTTVSGNTAPGYSSTWSSPAPVNTADKKAATKEKEQDDLQQTMKVADVVQADSKDEDAGKQKQQVVVKRDENRAASTESKKTEERKNAEDKPATTTANAGLAKEIPGNAFQTAADSTETLSNSNMEQVYSVVDEMPKFPGGEAEMLKYIQKNLKYPEIEKETAVGGKIYVQFVVDKKGNIKNPKIFKGLTPEFDEEVLRVVRSMPKWSPGKIKGSPVDVLMNIPVEIYLK
ncbi:MAG: hypothetical protein JWO44_1987 [Bacteroidetes bacterium]|nr:hypothetical protein [Bacteroidota bacterium]